MLARKNRLRHEKDFNRVLREGKVINQNLFIIKVIPNNLNYTRYGIIVSSKVSRKATVRNRLKRQLRALAYLSLKKIRKAFDIVIIAKKGTVGKDYHQLKTVFSLAIKKLS